MKFWQFWCFFRAQLSRFSLFRGCVASDTAAASTASESRAKRTSLAKIPGMFLFLSLGHGNHPKHLLGNGILVGERNIPPEKQQKIETKKYLFYPFLTVSVTHKPKDLVPVVTPPASNFWSMCSPQSATEALHAPRSFWRKHLELTWLWGITSTVFFHKNYSRVALPSKNIRF